MRKAIVVRTMQGILVGVLAAGLFLAMQGVASAGLIGVRLTSGAATVTCIDGDPCDSNASLGAVTFNGAVGVFNVNVTTGISYPLLGTPGLPHIDMNSVNVTSTGAATLDILASQTDYTGPLADTHFHGGGTQSNFSSLHQVYFDNANVQFNAISLIDSHPAVGPSFSFDNHPGGFPVDGSYSLTLRANMTAGPGTASTSFNHEFFVAPEPAWGLLLGPALGLVGLMGKRRRSSVTT